MSEKECCGSSKVKVKNNAGSGGAFYGLGFIGALVYFMQNSHSFLDVVLGILKSLVWPAFFVYHILKFLNI